jgi:hypothetical protein
LDGDVWRLWVIVEIVRGSGGLLVTIALIPKGTCGILDSWSLVACCGVPNSIAHTYISIKMMAGEAGVADLQAD